jgi:hypothetical protein
MRYILYYIYYCYCYVDRNKKGFFEPILHWKKPNEPEDFLQSPRQKWTEDEITKDLGRAKEQKFSRPEGLAGTIHANTYSLQGPDC